MEQEIGKYGTSRMDVKQVGELADIVKDLSEAEYYCSVSEAMAGGSTESFGYNQPMGNSRMGYGGNQGGSGGMGSRSGYGNPMGHSDPVSAIRDMLATANPETRAQIRNELLGM